DEVLSLFRKRRAAGMPNMGEIEDIDGITARSNSPALRDVPRALYIPEAARVDGGKMCDALTEGARHYGAEVIAGGATLVIRQGRMTGVAVDGREIGADAVIL